MAQFGWHVNIDNCIACRACEGACKQEFDLPVGVRRRRVLVEDGFDAGTGMPWRRHISLACHHCAKPACLHACPVQRYWKDEAAQAGVEALRAHFGMSGPYTGVVLMRPTKAQDATIGADCIGCKMCAAACPYGAPQWDETAGVMDKCTACVHRLFPPEGSLLPEARRLPACVVSCAANALAFGDLADIANWAQGQPGAPINTTTSPPAGGKDIADPTLTNPSIRFTPKR